MLSPACHGGPFLVRGSRTDPLPVLTVLSPSYLPLALSISCRTVPVPQQRGEEPRGLCQTRDGDWTSPDLFRARPCRGAQLSARTRLCRVLLRLPHLIVPQGRDVSGPHRARARPSSGRGRGSPPPSPAPFCALGQDDDDESGVSCGYRLAVTHLPCTYVSRCLPAWPQEALGIVGETQMPPCPSDHRPRSSGHPLTSPILRS